jgi:hypothetical protein
MTERKEESMPDHLPAGSPQGVIPASPLPAHAAEGAARRYLASRGQPPIAAQPIGRALPLLLAETAQQGRDAWRDMRLAAGLALAGLVLMYATLTVPLHQEISLVLLQLNLQGLAAIAAGVWAAILLEQGTQRLIRFRRLQRLLRHGAWPAAFHLAGTAPR